MPQSPGSALRPALLLLLSVLLLPFLRAEDSPAVLEAKARQGDTAAMLDLAHLYDWGTAEGVAQDLAVARTWYRKAADQGSESAQLELGKMAYDGRGEQADPAAAAKWFRLAADQGNSAAQHLLAGLYEQGEGIAKNESEALAWYRRAAEQDDSDAQFALGAMYAEGRGTTVNPAEAARWWQRAAHAQHSEAATRLEALVGANAGLKSKVRALAPAATQQLIARASKGDSSAQYELATDLLEGDGGLLVDDAEAFKWLSQASAQGHALAQNKLAESYALGRGATQDNAAAERWWRKAAAQNLPEAHFNLARLLADSDDAPNHREEILKEYGLAADAGEKNALRALFDTYLAGGIAPIDHATAFKYGQKLAEAGDNHVWYEMAELAEGDGDKAAAHRWYEKARQGGDLDAGSAVERLDAENQKIAAAQPTPAPAPKGVTAASPAPTPKPEALPAGETNAARLGQLREIFEKEFAAADSLYARNDAVKRFSLAVTSTTFNPPLDLTARSEAVLQAVGPKADANIAEAYGYIMAIDSYTFDPKTLPRFTAAATRDAIRVGANKTTEDYDRRQAALNTMDATFKRAAAGEAQAQFQLGRFFLTNAIAHDEASAADWFRKAAANGMAAASIALSAVGDAALKSGGAAFQVKDYATALRQWKLAADLGSQQAWGTMGVLYQNGYGVPLDLAEAARWYQKAVDGGNALAAISLSIMYEKGNGVPADPAQALKLARLGAQSDNPLGTLQLAHCLVWGVGAAPNDAEALALYRKLADKGDATAKDWVELLQYPDREWRSEQALYMAALTKQQGTGDHTGNSRDWVEYSAFLGNAQAKLWLADWHEVPSSYPASQENTAGTKAHREKNETEAVRLWRIAAAAGNPAAMTNLGVAYYMGWGVDKNLATAIDWYTKAGDAGLVQGRVRARSTRAEIAFAAGVAAYRAGNYPEALAQWQRAAAAGNANSVMNIGVLHEKGLGFAADQKEALVWYQRAAALGSEQAKAALIKQQGLLDAADQLTQGRAALKVGDTAKAELAFEKSAALGNPASLGALGDMYAQGNGVSKDTKKAIALYRQAEAKGDAIAGITATALEESQPLEDLMASQKEMAALKDQINGITHPKAPAIKGAKTGVKELQKNSPWTTAEILAALQAGADHDALATAIKADKTKDLYGIDVTRIHQTPAGQGIEEFGKLNMALHENSLPGAGPWTYDMAKLAVLTRRQLTKREPKIVDSPELRKKAASGDVPSILAYYSIPTASLTQGDPDPKWYGAPLEQRILATKYVRGYWVIADTLHNNVDKAKDDPARRAELLFQSAEAGEPKGMRELGMLFMEPGNPAVATNYAEAEYWLLEAAARAAEGTLEDVYVNPGRDVAFFYSFAKSNGGPEMWPLPTADDATLRWAREMIHRGGKLREVAELELQELQRHAHTGDVRARMDALPPEVGRWTPEEVTQLDTAAQAGDAAAAVKLGNAYATGRGVHQRDFTAVNYYRLAAAKGSAPAMRALAYHYGAGYGVNKDFAQRLAWLEKAGAAGDASAWREAGDLQHYAYPEAVGAIENYPRALAAYNQAAAAGDPGALMGLALMYRYGRGVPKDETKAMEFVHRAAESGDGAAQYEIGSTLAKSGDKPNAIRWLQKAIANPATSSNDRAFARQQLTNLQPAPAAN